MKRFFIIVLSVVLLCNAAEAQKNHGRQEKKFVFMSSIGFASGAGQLKLPDYARTIEDWKIVSNKNTNVMIHQLVAYQFNNYFYMGVGAGLNLWRHTAFVPVYLNLSVNMIDRKVAPMAFVNLGYGFKWYMQSTPEVVDKVIHGSDPGPMGEAGIGLRVKFNDKLAITVTGVYQAQVSSVRYTSNPANQNYSSIITDDVKKNQLYHFAGVRVGLLY